MWELWHSTANKWQQMLLLCELEGWEEAMKKEEVLEDLKVDGVQDAK